jgi:ribonuclease Z
VLRNLKISGIDLASIRYVFLSHRHSDHILGLEPLLLHIGLYAARAGRRAESIDILAHPTVLDVAREMTGMLSSTGPSLIESQGTRLRWRPLTPGEQLTLRANLRLTPFVVDHAPFDGTTLGCAVTFDHASAVRKLVYSGDTRPTPELDQHARDADILIHEAGGLDANAVAVHQVGHTTAGEAARLAEQVEAAHLFLTHLPDDTLVGPVEAECKRFFGGGVAVPDDLESYDLSEVCRPALEVP